MDRALELAKCGWGRTNPNPLVGAVIVKNGEIISEGFHKKLGDAHAEINAITGSKQDVRGSTLYVNLEPCSHYGRTPPCAKAIIEAGISEVVIAMTDPNPKVSEQGIQMLKNAGIRVVTGVCKDKAEKLNEIFIKYITKKRPFVIMKTAMTLDGKIATAKGDSRWISSDASRQYVHTLRNRVSAVMVGVNTVIADNPMLTTRLKTGSGRDAARIVVDSEGRMPVNSNIINANSNAGVILAASSRIEESREKLFTEMGVKVVKADDGRGRVDLCKLMDELYRLEIDSVLLEGGGTINWAALSSGIVDKVIMFIAPRIIGGSNAVTPVEGEGINRIADAIRLKDVSVTTLDGDIVVEGYIEN
ncbi:MAG: bifunctional diaminohydroxyphosphoribosylaminopyrimidine deaminase/5-amino-6-(5-phosphoribosylamino)uracil reductase RibD [Firmicutes bacterium]|nr:bifunctional diaminohydroxyphosphoribosylaminopyrimidine deaminase/5-amino-6-(5-phosphoribosylamino)uracil reductase RibD [Bacillota bacterium]